MIQAGKLKERVDRIRKKLAEGKGKLDPALLRELRKRLKRTQRRRRSILRAEARAKPQAGGTAGEEKQTKGTPPSS